MKLTLLLDHEEGRRQILWVLCAARVKKDFLDRGVAEIVVTSGNDDIGIDRAGVRRAIEPDMTRVVHQGVDRGGRHIASTDGKAMAAKETAIAVEEQRDRFARRRL